MKLIFLSLTFAIFLNYIELSSQKITGDPNPCPVPTRERVPRGTTFYPFGTQILVDGYIIGTVNRGAFHHLTLNGVPVEEEFAGNNVRPVRNNWYNVMRRQAYLMRLIPADANEGSHGTSADHQAQ